MNAAALTDRAAAPAATSTSREMDEQKHGWHHRRHLDEDHARVASGAAEIERQGAATPSGGRGYGGLPLIVRLSSEPAKAAALARPMVNQRSRRRRGRDRSPCSRRRYALPVAQGASAPRLEPHSANDLSSPCRPSRIHLPTSQLALTLSHARAVTTPGGGGGGTLSRASASSPIVGTDAQPVK